MDVEDKQVIKEVNDLLDSENKEVKTKLEQAFQIVKEKLKADEGDTIPTMTTDEYILLESIEAMYNFIIFNFIGTDMSTT